MVPETCGSSASTRSTKRWRRCNRPVDSLCRPRHRPRRDHDRMTDSSGTPMFPARDYRLTPEAVAERGFSHVKRGYAESEVRAFLRMVADDLGSMRTRER